MKYQLQMAVRVFFWGLRREYLGFGVSALTESQCSVDWFDVWRIVEAPYTPADKMSIVGDGYQFNTRNAKWDADLGHHVVWLPIAWEPGRGSVYPWIDIKRRYEERGWEVEPCTAAN